MSPVTSPMTFHEVTKVSIVTRGNDVSGISVNQKSVAGKAFFPLSLRYPILPLSLFHLLDMEDS